MGDRCRLEKFEYLPTEPHVGFLRFEDPFSRFSPRESPPRDVYPGSRPGRSPQGEPSRSGPSNIVRTTALSRSKSPPFSTRAKPFVPVSRPGNTWSTTGRFGRIRASRLARSSPSGAAISASRTSISTCARPRRSRDTTGLRRRSPPSRRHGPRGRIPGAAAPGYWRFARRSGWCALDDPRCPPFGTRTSHKASPMPARQST